MEEQYEDVGFIKYSGNDVPHGIIDAASAGTALLGLDEAIRFFNEKQSPEFARIDYEIPIRTEGGSWVAVVLGSLGLVAGTFAITYAKKAAEKMAENDFKDIGMKDVLKKSMGAIQNLTRLVKHTKKSKGWETASLVWRNANTEIGIKNDQGEILYLPTEQFRWFCSMPPKLMIKMTSVVREERYLTIGLGITGSVEEVIVRSSDKQYFVEQVDVEDEEFLFPELEHGKSAKLEGRLIRGNEAANSVGLEYMGHVLNCVPNQGNIRRYKRALFLKCIVEGTVTRLTKQRLVAEKRPTIIISKITPLQTETQSDLFDS